MDLRAFLDDLQERLPYDFVRIERTVAPHQFEVTALLQHLENQKKFPVLFFEKPLDLNGKPSAFPAAEQCLRDPSALRFVSGDETQRR